MIFKFFKRATDKDAIERMVHQPPLGKDWDWNVCPACDQKEIYFVIPIKNRSFWFCGLLFIHFLPRKSYAAGKQSLRNRDAIRTGYRGITRISNTPGT